MYVRLFVASDWTGLSRASLPVSKPVISNLDHAIWVGASFETGATERQRSRPGNRQFSASQIGFSYTRITRPANVCLQPHPHQYLILILLACLIPHLLPLPFNPAKELAEVK
jgi:hypothetical protein